MNAYFDYVWVDIFNIVFFLILGIKIFDEICYPEKADSNTENEENPYIRNNNNNNNAQQNIDLTFYKLLNITFLKNIKIFIKIFFIVLISEIGDKTQFTTIYLSNTNYSIKTLYAVIITQLILTLFAIYLGRHLQDKISDHNYNLLCGIVFFLFAFIGLYLTFSKEAKILKQINSEDYENISENILMPYKSIIETNIFNSHNLKFNNGTSKIS
jgi:putative Ca2+/H+ antiporter (TMEM165/GDT1 family)